MSLTDIEKRFRSGPITQSDCDELKTIILATDDVSTLESAIYMYGYSCGFDADVFEVCKRYIFDRPEPGLTAVCMRVQVLYLPDTPDLRVSHQAAVGSGSLASSVGTTSGISTMPSASMSA